MNNELFKQTIQLFQNFEEVDAITLGGSMASKRGDSFSDYDVYVYLNRPLSQEKRKSALSQTCRSLGIGRTYWGADWDDCILNDGIAIELTYELIKNTRKGLRDTLENCHAHNGYTTCFCYIIFNAVLLYDPNGIYAALLKRFTMPYPENLRKNIIAKNMDMLKGITPSYVNQIEKAIKRNDLVSVNHRLTEFIKTYFDVLFALNRKFHPGEKRLLELAPSLCEWMPVNFESDFRVLLNAGGNGTIIPLVRKLTSSLDELVKKYL